MSSICKWCGENKPDDGEAFCQTCKDSPANPARYKEHTTHDGQYFVVDFDLFCARIGAVEIEPRPEDVQKAVEAMAKRIDTILLARVHEFLKAEEGQSWRDRPPLL